SAHGPRVWCWTPIGRPGHCRTTGCASGWCPPPWPPPCCCCSPCYSRHLPRTRRRRSPLDDGARRMRVGLPQAFEPGAIGETVEGDDAVAQHEIVIHGQRDRAGLHRGVAHEGLAAVHEQWLRMPEVFGGAEEGDPG